jgi:hypothetical protein
MSLEFIISKISPLNVIHSSRGSSRLIGFDLVRKLGAGEAVSIAARREVRRKPSRSAIGETYNIHLAFLRLSR